MCNILSFKPFYSVVYHIVFLTSCVPTAHVALLTAFFIFFSLEFNVCVLTVFQVSWRASRVQFCTFSPFFGIYVCGFLCIFGCGAFLSWVGLRCALFVCLFFTCLFKQPTCCCCMFPCFPHALFVGMHVA